MPSDPGRDWGGAYVTERRRASEERAAASVFLRRWGRGEGEGGGTGAWCHAPEAERAGNRDDFAEAVPSPVWVTSANARASPLSALYS